MSCLIDRYHEGHLNRWVQHLLVRYIHAVVSAIELVHHRVGLYLFQTPLDGVLAYPLPCIACMECEF